MGRAAITFAAGLLGFALAVGALAVRDGRAGDRFDLVRWELDTIPNRWAGVLGAPFRTESRSHDEVLREYFTLPEDDARRSDLENEVERIIEGRIDAVLSDLGLSARISPPRSVFPPVDVELAISPRVLVTSPRDVIRREDTDLLRPDIDLERAVEIEEETVEASPELSALVVPSGGVATYPAIVSERSSYAGVVGTSAHEWVHHYLWFYPLGFNYYDSGDLRTINETVADIIGDEIAAIVLQRWGDPTVQPLPADRATEESDGGEAEAVPADDVPPPPPPSDPDLDPNEVLRELRLEVDELLAEGAVEEAERRMEEVRQQLEDAGYYIRKLNQAYFAWYGTYAARPDAVDPLGDYLREVRVLTGSLPAYVETIRGWTSRADVEQGLVELGGTLAE